MRPKQANATPGYPTVPYWSENAAYCLPAAVRIRRSLLYPRAQRLQRQPPRGARRRGKTSTIGDSCSFDTDCEPPGPPARLQERHLRRRLRHHRLHHRLLLQCVQRPLRRERGRRRRRRNGRRQRRRNGRRLRRRNRRRLRRRQRRRSGWRFRRDRRLADALPGLHQQHRVPGQRPLHQRPDPHLDVLHAAVGLRHTSHQSWGLPHRLPLHDRLDQLRAPVHPVRRQLSERPGRRRAAAPAEARAVDLGRHRFRNPRPTLSAPISARSATSTTTASPARSASAAPATTTAPARRAATRATSSRWARSASTPTASPPSARPTSPPTTSTTR